MDHIHTRKKCSITDAKQDFFGVFNSYFDGKKITLTELQRKEALSDDDDESGNTISIRQCQVLTCTLGVHYHCIQVQGFIGPV